MVKFKLLDNNVMMIEYFNYTSQIIIDIIDDAIVEFNLLRHDNIIRGESHNLFKLLYRLSCTYEIILS